MRKLRRALASRPGPIVGIVSEKINPMAYVHERAICVDTTAAGGNASLLATS
jgi:RHH-type proline utilization regulon transcriptional repressor/proline dehydrogenase/delta 1-pyrroline-5-carboxylate dehydrogenase